MSRNAPHHPANLDDGHVVLVVGPSPDLMGGMATVIRQTLACRLQGLYRSVLFPNTQRLHDHEGIFSRIRRHGIHLVEMNKQIQSHGAKLVHIHTCSGFSFWRGVLDMLVAQGAGARVILHVHGAAFDQFHARAGRAGKCLIGWALRKSDQVVALSRGWAEILRGMSPRADITIIENAVSLPSSLPQRPTGGPLQLLFLGKMDSWKGIHDLLEACALLKGRNFDFKLTLAGPPGSAGDAAVLETAFKKHGLFSCTRYLGPVQGDAKDDLFRSADVYVQPSHHEGMPVAVLEALAWGLPIVATSVGAVPEVIRHESEGLLVPPHRPDELAAAIQALDDGDRRQRMSSSARQLAESRFSLVRLDQDLLRLYEKLSSPRVGFGGSQARQSACSG